MADDLKYGYKGAEPTQSFGNNTGVFDPNDINNLIADNKWTQFGQLELIETQTFSGVSTVDFTSINESTYNVHFMTLNNIQHTGGLSTTRFQLYESGVLETASVYEYAYQAGTSGALFQEGRSTADDKLYWSYNNNGTTQDARDSENGYAYFYNLGNSAKYSNLSYQMSFTDLGLFRMTFGSGLLPQASTVDGIRVDFNSVNTNGTASLYGIRYS